MSTMFQNTAVKTIAAARSIHSSATVRSAAVSIGHHVSMNASPDGISTTSKAAKAIAYTAVGTATVLGGVSILFKDEVVYWTPNVR
ncbi:hypothetical protein BGW38_009977, partial [Lunasporangiospora selenospora]